MRGQASNQSSMICLISPETSVPMEHPIRALKALADAALDELSPVFEDMYAATGRPSVPPERLLKGQLLIALYSKDEADGDGDNNGWGDFRGQRRSNDTHASNTDPESRLMRKGNGQPAKLSFMGHALVENRHGLLVDLRVSPATGFAERELAIEMMADHDRLARATVGADRGYDTQDFVENCRALAVTPHVAQNNTRRRSAIDERTTRHDGYAISQRLRMRIEQVFGWAKTIGGLRRTRYRGVARTQFLTYLVAATYNLVRITNLRR